MASTQKTRPRQQQQQQQQQVDAHVYHALLLCVLGTCLFLFGEYFHAANHALFRVGPTPPPPPLLTPTTQPHIAYEFWNTNESKGHVYPYLASFITFSCLLMTLILLIVCGGNLG
jgi:hypothetical protein